MAAEIENHPTKTGSEILKSILLNVLDAIYWINSSWNEVDDTTMIKCFNKTGFNDNIFSDSECDPQPPQLLIVSFFLGLRIPLIAWSAVRDPGLLKFCPAFRFSPLLISSLGGGRGPTKIIQYSHQLTSIKF